VHSVYNASRVIKSVLIQGLRYGSSPLLSMRIHDIAVVADPNRRLHDEPEPVVYDGTTEGLYKGSSHFLLIPTLEDILSYMIQWWTGWWPELHTKFEQTSLDGPSIIYQEKCDLLGQSEVERTSLHVSDDNSIEEQPFFEALAANVIDVWIVTLATKIAVLLAGVSASMACAACTAPVSTWLLILAAGLVGVYTGLLIVDLVITIEEALTMTDNAIMRWWIIVASMSLVVLGWVFYGILIPYQGFYNAAKAAAQSTNFANWMCSLTEPSVIFLMWKVCLIGVIFAAATMVFTLTVLGLL
jgi:hypothetical protein